jgi:hypothetical protein
MLAQRLEFVPGHAGKAFRLLNCQHWYALPRRPLCFQVDFHPLAHVGLLPQQLQIVRHWQKSGTRYVRLLLLWIALKPALLVVMLLPVLRREPLLADHRDGTRWSHQLDVHFCRPIRRAFERLVLWLVVQEPRNRRNAVLGLVRLHSLGRLRVQGTLLALVGMSSPRVLLELEPFLPKVRVEVSVRTQPLGLDQLSPLLVFRLQVVLLRLLVFSQVL